MNTMLLNKIAGALLGSLLTVTVFAFYADALFRVPKPAVPGFVISGAGAPAAATAAATPAEPLPVRLAKADIEVGKQQFKQCAACHTPEKGGANRTGPNLWNVVSRQKAHIAGFKYSAGMAERGGKSETWSFVDLDKFIENPKAFQAGTAMAFAGIKNPDQRAAVIAYLRSLADSPVALPTP